METMNQTIRQIPLDYIKPNPWQTRRGDPDPAYIEELANDIAANGLLQIPIGRMLDDKGAPVGFVKIEAHGGAFAYLKDNPGAVVQLAFGHNRLAAYHRLHVRLDEPDIPADWSVMPVDVRVLTDIQMADFAWAENDKRQDFTPLERAMAIRKRMDDFSWSQKDIAEHLRVSAPRVSNALRLLDLPEDILQLMAKGELSERVALSLSTLFDLPESLRKEAETQYSPSIKPSYIVTQAIEGLSSDGIREHIERLVKNYSKDLHQAIWDLDYIFITSEAIYWPECRTCELRHKPLNICIKPDCYEAKTRAWKADYLKSASQVSGILPLETEIGIYEVTHLSYRPSAETILNSGCENLRLAYISNGEGRFTLEERGFSKATIVCRQKNSHCQCLRGLEILEAQRRRAEIQAIQDTPKAADDASPEETEEVVQPLALESQPPEPEQPTAADLQDLVKQDMRNEKEYKKLAKEAQDRAAQLIVDGLAADDLGAWRLVYDRVAAGENWKNRPIDVLELRQGIAKKIINHHVSYIEPQDIPERLKKVLIDAGLQMPVF